MTETKVDQVPRECNLEIQHFCNFRSNCKCLWFAQDIKFKQYSEPSSSSVFLSRKTRNSVSLRRILDINYGYNSLCSWIILLITYWCFFHVQGFEFKQFIKPSSQFIFISKEITFCVSRTWRVSLMAQIIIR